MVRPAKNKNKKEAENGETDEVKLQTEDTDGKESASNEEVEKVETEKEEKTEDEEPEESTSELTESKEAEIKVKAGKRKGRLSNANSKKTKVSDEVTDNSTKRKREKSVDIKGAGERRTSRRSKPSVENDVKKRKTSNKENEKSDADYEVLKIVNMRQKKDGKKEFLIRWKGFSSKDDTWEPEEHLDCRSLIDSFLEKNETVQNVGKAKSIKNKELKKKEDKNETNYEVEKIIDVKEKSGKKEFLVRWKGYKARDDSWVREGDMSCTLLIEEFMEKSKEADTKTVVTKSGRSIKIKK